MVIRTVWLLLLLDIPALLLAGIRVQGVVPCKKKKKTGRGASQAEYRVLETLCSWLLACWLVISPVAGGLVELRYRFN